MALRAPSKKLLARLPALDHSDRLAAISAHARELDKDAAVELIAALESGGMRDRRLALFAAAARRDLAPLECGLVDPSVSVRGLAASMFGRLADTLPDELVDELDEVTIGVLSAAILKHRRPTAITLCQSLAARGRLNEAARLLSACNRDLIERELAERAWPREIWVRLAKYAPDVAIVRVESAFSGNDRPDLVWLRFDSGFWNALAKSRPEALARFIDRFAGTESLPAPVLGALTPLARAMPGRVVGWLASRLKSVSITSLPPALLNRLRLVDDESLAPLCASLAQRDSRLLAHLLSRLPHARRGALFLCATRDLDTARKAWSPELLEVLPDWLRAREAARMLELEGAKTSASWRRTLLGFQLIEDARAPLELECTGAQALDRAEAYAALILSTGRSRRGMTETLAYAARTKNEQDPVRMAVLGALAAVPPSLFEDAEALNAVVAPIFSARDTSYMTRGSASRLAHRLLIANATSPQGPIFRLGLSILERLAEHKGTADLPALHRNLPRGAETAIARVLLPWIDAARKREQVHMVYAVWGALGKRAWLVPELGDRLRSVVFDGPKAQAAWAATLWLGDPKTREARVRELLRRSKSAIYIGAVTQYLHARRQSLLAPRFDSKPHTGRFLQGKVAHVPTFSSGLEKWSDALEQKYTALLRAALAEPKRFSAHRFILTGALAELPLRTVEETMSEVAKGDVIELEAALGAIVWNDQPAGALPLLLEHLDGDRARVAAYALPRLARLLPASQLIDALAEVLARPKLRITSHKEVVRLLGRYSTARAIGLLGVEWKKELHRDVRIAALHAARSALDEPLAWEILTSASTNPSADVARALVEVPAANIGERYQPRYLLIMTETADHADPVVRAALFNSLATWYVGDPVTVVELAARVIERLDPLDPWFSALPRLADGARSGATRARLASCVSRLRDAANVDIEPSGERDQLPRRRLHALVGAITFAGREPAILESLAEIAALLEPSPIMWSLAARARLFAASNDEFSDAIAALADAAPDPLSSLSLVRQVRDEAAALQREWAPATALALCDRLARGASLHRQCAVSLVAGFAPQWGWGEEWRRRLLVLRGDTDLAVKIAALDVEVA